MSIKTDHQFRKGRVRNLTLDDDWTSPWFTGSGKDTYLSLQLHIDNTNLVGTLEIEVANEKDNAVVAAFKDQDGNNQTSITVSSGTDVDQLLVFSPWTEALVRIKFTHTSGSGVLRATAQTKR